MSARLPCGLFALVALGSVTGLATGCAHPGPLPAQTRAEAAFAKGEDARAEETFREARAEASSEDAAHRAQLFELLARRAQSDADGVDSVRVELRTFAVSAPHSPWARLAGLFADEMGQVDALRWALQRSGAELAGLERRVAELEASVERGEKIARELGEVLTAVRDERAALQRTVRELEEQLAGREALIAELQAELEALKSIDMSRTP